MIAAPMFHSWGFAHFTLGMALGSTLVLRRRFDPEGTLSATAQHECTALAVVPVMLQRILELPRRDDRRATTCARCGSSPPAARRCPASWRPRSWTASATCSTTSTGRPRSRGRRSPSRADLRAAPGTAGRPPLGTIVKLYDEDGREVPRGETGRIFVGNELVFDGYTGGGGKDVIDGLMSTGDVGHFDEGGRLFVDGRDDEMIVSGGENVFPREVEDLLADHQAVDEAAVVGVDDERVRPAAARRSSSAPDEGSVTEDELKAYVKANLAALQGAARGRLPRRAAAQRDRQGAQARSSASST